MLTKFGKCSIIDVWGGPDSALECNSMKSDTKSCSRSYSKNGNIHSIKYRRY